LRTVIALDGAHGVVHVVPILAGRLAFRCSIAPLSAPEDAGGAVFVGLGSAPSAAGFKLGMFRLKGVGDVLEKDQSQDDMFVFRRVHIVAQRVA